MAVIIDFLFNYTLVLPGSGMPIYLYFSIVQWTFTRQFICSVDNYRFLEYSQYSVNAEWYDRITKIYWNLNYWIRAFLFSVGNTTIIMPLLRRTSCGIFPTTILCSLRLCVWLSLCEYILSVLFYCRVQLL